jgi:putative DNA primase/helicase
LPGKVDFRRVADAALGAVERLVPLWLPQGRREGHEWKALNPTRADSKLGSFSINLNTGAWADFATDDKGGDLVACWPTSRASPSSRRRATLRTISVSPTTHRRHPRPRR